MDSRTSDGGNRSHHVSLPIILKKTKVGQILQYSCISLLLVPILLYWIQVSASLNVLLYLGPKWPLFVLNIYKIEKYFFNIVPPDPNKSFCRCTCYHILHNINERLVGARGGGEQYHTAINVARKPEPKYVTWTPT